MPPRRAASSRQCRHVGQVPGLAPKLVLEGCDAKSGVARQHRVRRCLFDIALPKRYCAGRNCAQSGHFRLGHHGCCNELRVCCCHRVGLVCRHNRQLQIQSAQMTLRRFIGVSVALAGRDQESGLHGVTRRLRCRTGRDDQHDAELMRCRWHRKRGNAKQHGTKRPLAGAKDVRTV